jgi:hypothetical protein
MLAENLSHIGEAFGFLAHHPINALGPLSSIEVFSPGRMRRMHVRVKGDFVLGHSIYHVFASALSEGSSQLANDADTGSDPMLGHGVCPPPLSVISGRRLVIFTVEGKNQLNRH